jgi:phage repressor protein C with HTH and peptisase S24 domain
MQTKKTEGEQTSGMARLKKIMNQTNRGARLRHSNPTEHDTTPGAESRAAIQSVETVDSRT